MEAVGQPTDGNISKAIMASELTKLRSRLLTVEDIYYSFRDDLEDALQDAKYRLDKLAQMLGEANETE